MLNLKDFDTYQKEARKTAIYPNIGSNLWYPTLGLTGEAGEVAEMVKKYYRDGTKMYGLSKELGDVLWYIANLAEELGLSLSSIAQENLSKLQDRKNRNKLHGSGDNR